MNEEGGRSAAAAITTNPSWRGLAGLTPALRREMAGILTPMITEQLERCLEDVLTDWMLGRIEGERDVDPKDWADRLNTQRSALAREFSQAINRDFLTAKYPPEYDFSGVAFAKGDSELTILDNYQSSRRSLRHQLEARLRSHRYLYFMMKRAALDNHRFQYPNWAPWSPLHWFERLLETSERRFGHSPQSLALASAYVKHLTRNESTLLTAVVETIDGLGLVRDSARVIEPEAASDHRASWESVVRTQTLRHQSSTSPPPPLRTDTPAAPETGVELPGQGANIAQWARWAEDLAERFHARAPTQGESHARGAEDSAPLPDLEGSRTPLDVSREALKPPIQKLLREIIERIVQEARFDDKVRAILTRLPDALARAVKQDLDFLRQPSHPLRIWLGDLINTGLRVTPASDPAQGAISPVLKCMELSAAQFEREADTLDRKGAQDLLQEWRTAITETLAQWHDRQAAAVIPAFRRIEHAAAAWRALTLSVVRTGAELPMESAQLIADAWRELKGLDEQDGAELHEDIKAIVQAICLRAMPATVNPMVHQLMRNALKRDIPKERLQAIVSRLGRAHVQTMHAPINASRFNAQDQLRKQRSIRFEHDAPDLHQDLDDDFVFRAAQLRVRDWFEFTEPATKEPIRMALVWRGAISRCFVFVGLDELSHRSHSLRGVAEELRTNRLQHLPQDNPLDAILA